MNPRHVLPDDVDAAGGVLASGFYDDPVMRWLMPDDSTRLGDLTEMFTGTVAVTRSRGHTYVLAAPDGEIAAAAVWGPPLVELMSADERAERPATVVNRYGDEGLERLKSLGALMQEHHPTDPHFYLWILAVDASRQGQGLGARLMAPVLAHLDACAIPAYLESSNPRNVPFYERAGFATRAEFRPEGGPLLTAMWRDPR
jgi:ribosomal protein S18 acetylase RimI-like enzyme